MTARRVLRTATPVIVGVADVVQRPGEGALPHDPAALAAIAARRAAEDAGAPSLLGEVDSLDATDVIGVYAGSGAAPSLLGEVDSLDVVNILGWPYDDAAHRVAEATGSRPARRVHSEVGGHQPTALLDAAAARIAAGESEVALVAGGEAMWSLESAMKAASVPPWPAPPADARSPDAGDFATGWMAVHRLRLPTEVYPLYEQGSRRAAGMTQRQAIREAAEQWAAASEVAARNPSAWQREPCTPEEIVTVSAGNRMVAWPYPKLLSARLGVDQAAAALVTSTATARRLGIPEDRWVHPWGGAHAKEADDVLARPTFERTDAGGAALDGALELAALGAEELDLVELYSCFPCVPRMAVRHLELPPRRPITVTGGLTFFGGPANNYMLHAVVAMTRALRAGAGERGLLYGQGGYATKHHAMVLSRRPADGYAVDDAAARQAGVDAEPGPAFAADYEGEGTIETFTMPYGRDGTPVRALVVARTPDGARFAGDLAPDPDAVAVLTALDDEPLGRLVRVRRVAGAPRIELA